jgi:amino acid transporter
MVRLLLWILLIAIAGLTVFILFPPAGVIPGSQQISAVQAWMFSAVMFVSMLSISLLMKSRDPERKTWIGIHSAILGLGAVAFSWLPQWVGFIMAAVLVLFVLTPNVLGGIARRRASAGHPQAAVFYARLVGVFHPSRQARFQLSFLRAGALRSTEDKIAAYRSLTEWATPEQLALLNCFIAVAEDDWGGVLGQIRSAGEASGGLKALEIRALGELGRVDEMLKTYVWAESDLPATNLPFCRLYALAFSGHLDGVRSLLNRQLRFVTSRNKAYWIFIVGAAAGKHDDDARRTLAAYVDAADNETFRRAAQRHLAGAPVASGGLLADESSNG